MVMPIFFGVPLEMSQKANSYTIALYKFVVLNTSNMKKLLLFVSILISFSANCQDAYGERIKHQIESESFGDQREIDVYLPYFYKDTPVDSFMVIYVFDGQFDPYLSMAAHTAEYLTGMEEFPPFIAVGIRTKHRPKEFTPAETNPVDGEEPWGGESALLEAFLNDEVFPLIENTYRTIPLRLGIGHSLGGTFVSNTLFKNSDMFKGVISISPNTSYDNRQLIQTLNKTLTSGETVRAFHFMTAGTSGNMENNFRASSIVVDSVYHAHPQKSLIWEFKTYEGQNHSITPIQSISEGLQAFGKLLRLTDDIALEIMASDSLNFAKNIQSFYSKQSEWLGFRMKPSVDEINWLGYIAMQENQFNQALMCFDWAITLHPNDANIYDSKAEALENLGEFKQAYDFYGKALEKLILQKETMDDETYGFYLENFEENRARVKELL